MLLAIILDPFTISAFLEFQLVKGRRYGSTLLFISFFLLVITLTSYRIKLETLFPYNKKSVCGSTRFSLKHEYH